MRCRRAAEWAFGHEREPRHRRLPRDSERNVIALGHSSVLPAAVVAVGFAVVARAMGAVSDGGAVVGVAIAYLLMAAAGLGGFMPLLALFVLTVLATRWRRERKQSLGVAERDRGRVASQVLANLGAAGLCALAVFAVPHRAGIVLVGAMAALAEAAADTVSSEFGQAAARRARMIINFRSAPIGTNGAVSLSGTLAGCGAAAIIAWVSTFFGVVASRWGPTIAIAGICGMFLDSVLGASLENRGLMGNDSVNFVSTVFAADLALITLLLARG
jgi:uncharacterized protein (TIGR00297 family)